LNFAELGAKTAKRSDFGKGTQKFEKNLKQRE
jgi:hypothetical protein